MLLPLLFLAAVSVTTGVAPREPSALDAVAGAAPHGQSSTLSHPGAAQVRGLAESARTQSTTLDSQIHERASAVDRQRAAAEGQARQQALTKVNTYAAAAAKGGITDMIMKNMIIVIAAVCIGLMVGFATVAFFLWKSGLLGMFSKANGIPDAGGYVPDEAAGAMTEVAGEPAAAPGDEDKKKSKFSFGKK
jgi:hypothetical protein